VWVKYFQDGHACGWSNRPPGNSVQQVFDTEELEHEAAPDVEQPELILLNKLTVSAGLNEGLRRSCGVATAETTSVTARRRSMNMAAKTQSTKGQILLVKEEGPWGLVLLWGKNAVLKAHGQSH
jgi:hypothetical protein